MARLITIHKATHKFFTAPGTLAIGVGQLRGGMLYLNRINGAGEVCERAWAVETCARHLTGYGKGVAQDNHEAVEPMRNAWAYIFGAHTIAPAFCEIHKES